MTRDIPLGTVLRGTYEIVGVLGRGGMGTVFLANHLRLPGRQVAIKVLRNDGGLGKEVFVRFRREAEIASRLGHPNIVEVLDFDSLEDGSPFLVMECLRGQPLSRRMRRGALTLEEVFSFSRQMGSALQAAHRAGIVHRDLKPGNVFLVPTEVGGAVMQHVKLLDFGISKVIDSQSIHTQGGILLGTPQYMAPEQAQGKNQEVDPRTDIFAFGCMVYEMLARRLPFKDGPLPELIYRIVYDPPQPLASFVSGVPPRVEAAIFRALEKRPENRFADVGAFIEALTGSPLQTLPPITHPVPALSVRPSQLETVGGPKREEQGEGAPSKAATVSERRPLPGASSKRPVVNVPLEDVPTMTVEGPPPDGGAPEPGVAQEGPPQAATQAVRPDVGVVRRPAPFLEAGRSRKKWWGVAVAAGVAVAVALAMGLRPGGGGPTTGTPSEVAPPKPGAVPAGNGIASPGAEPAKPAQPGDATGQTAQGGVPSPQPGTALPEPQQTAPSKPKTSASIAPVALADLMAAEKALSRGAAEEALRLIRRSQEVQSTGTSFALLARAHCLQKDSANARTTWPSVPAWERTRVRQYCKRHGITL